MINDKIIVRDSFLFNDTEQVLAVYKPKTNPDGSYVIGHDGGVLIEKIGGVKVGTTGTVTGNEIRVHRNQLLHLKGQTALGGTNDFVSLFPVHLDQYQQTGWLPSEHIRVVGGTTSQIRKI